MCENEQKPGLEPDPHLEKRELRSRSYTTLMTTKSSGAGAVFMKSKAPEPEQGHFYDGSAALYVTFRIRNWHFITRDYFTVCACLRQPIAPRGFRVCVLAHRSGALTTFEVRFADFLLKSRTARVRTTFCCSAAAPPSKYFLPLLIRSLFVAEDLCNRKSAKRTSKSVRANVVLPLGNVKCQPV